MESTRKVLSVLVILAMVTSQQAAPVERRGKELINFVCAKTVNKEMCVEVLSSDPNRSPNADLKDLAIISLRVAAKNASGILSDAKRLINDDKLSPDIQQGLADCKETILDAESQLEDTLAALLVNSMTDTQVWLKAALAAIDTCDASIPGDDDILSVKSVIFRKLCNIAIATTRQSRNQFVNHVLAQTSA
ncbi:Pectinesterase inhibitor, partial [Mucuna pruriens]